LCAVLIGYSGWTVYNIGMTIARIRMLHGLEAQIASEALGG
jgi:hypothetical protein